MNHCPTCNCDMELAALNDLLASARDQIASGTAKIPELEAKIKEITDIPERLATE